MANETPSMVMYAAFKHFGMSNRETAELLLNTKLTFDGKMVQARVDESSQLSRRIVRTQPGELSIGLFNNFHLTCPRLSNLLVDKITEKFCKGDSDEAAHVLKRDISGTWAARITAAFEACNIDASMYRNMVSYIDHVELNDEAGRLTLHVMLFTIAGCVGSPNTASLLTMDYAAQVLGADYHTSPTIVGNDPSSGEMAGNGLGLVRIVDGRIKAGTNMHVLNPEGTEIGLFPKEKHTVTDVGDDVSRRHAYVWQQDGRWFVKDLNSTNGTRVLKGSSGAEVVVAPDDDPVEVAPTDTLCLGATTRFLLMPVLE